LGNLLVEGGTSYISSKHQLSSGVCLVSPVSPNCMRPSKAPVCGNQAMSTLRKRLLLLISYSKLSRVFSQELGRFEGLRRLGRPQPS